MDEHPADSIRVSEKKMESFCPGKSFNFQSNMDFFTKIMNLKNKFSTKKELMMIFKVK